MVFYFGNGFQLISTFQWLHFPAILLYIRLIRRSWIAIGSLFFIQYYMTFFAFQRQMPRHEDFVDDFAKKTSLAASIVYLVEHKLYHLTQLFELQKTFVAFFRPFIFPFLWTASWIVMTDILPTSSWGIHVFTMTDEKVVTEVLIPFYGIFGSEFVLAFFGVAIADFLVFCLSKNSFFSIENRQNKKSFFKPLFSSYMAVILLVIPTLHSAHLQTVPSLSLLDSYQHIPLSEKLTMPLKIQPVVAPLGIAQRDFKLHMSCIPGFGMTDDLVNRVRQVIDSFEFDISSGHVPFRPIATADDIPEQLCKSKEASTASRSHIRAYDASRDISALLPSSLVDGDDLEGFPVHVVTMSEKAIIDSVEDEECLFRRFALSLKPRTILAFTYSRSPPLDPTTDHKMKLNRLAVLAHPSTLTHLPADSVLSPVVELFRTSKLHKVPLFEPLTQEDSLETHKFGSSSLPKGMRAISTGLNGAICFDLDFPDAWDEIPANGLIINPSVTWGVEGFRELHARKQELVARQVGATLMRCSANGESIFLDGWGQSHSRQLTRNGDIFRASGHQKNVDVGLLMHNETIITSVMKPSFFKDGEISFWNRNLGRKTFYSQHRLSPHVTNFIIRLGIVITVILLVSLHLIYLPLILARWGIHNAAFEKELSYQMAIPPSFHEQKHIYLMLQSDRTVNSQQDDEDTQLNVIPTKCFIGSHWCAEVRHGMLAAVFGYHLVKFFLSCNALHTASPNARSQMLTFPASSSRFARAQEPPRVGGFLPLTFASAPPSANLCIMQGDSGGAASFTNNQREHYSQFITRDDSSYSSPQHQPYAFNNNTFASNSGVEI